MFTNMWRRVTGSAAADVSNDRTFFILRFQRILFDCLTLGWGQYYLSKRRQLNALRIGVTAPSVTPLW